MASDYKAIHKQNLQDYGRRVGHVGRLVTDLYGDSAHFILELLQNAEDALGRRDSDSDAPRTVKFDLAAQELRVSHYGRPFDEADVRGICAIGEGTKEEDITQIGRFGIGFKSVYRFTDRPQVHSGVEDFYIENYVWPSAAPRIQRDPAETVFVMPLRNPDEHQPEVANGLRGIGLDALLFLREIDTVDWSIAGGESGTFVRQSEELAEHVRRITLIGESSAHEAADQEWLVFSKPMHGKGGKLAGHVEVAFFIEDNHVSPVSQSNLVVFFPTVVTTNLGLRIQGPYRTTPSRDNVPKRDRWNQACVESTGELLVDALLWLREHDMLNADVLGCLPLVESMFDDELFSPLYEKTKAAFIEHRLLPVSGGDFSTSGNVKIARSGALRKLFTPTMLGDVFQADEPLYWLSGEITDRSAPEITLYLRDVLDVDEVRPLNVFRHLTATFLERRSNGWIGALYEFMNVQRDLHREAKQEWPLIRLSNGRHVMAYNGDIAQAYLPCEWKTGFPTVHIETCATDGAMQFLEAIGLSMPDPVDDVISNVIPKYERGRVDVSDSDYADDINRLVEAFQTDSTERRRKLVDKLKSAHFVYATDTRDCSSWARPNKVYFKTDRLAALFEGVEDVLFVSSNYECLRGEEVRTMLVACGASRYLHSEPVKCTLSEHEMSEIRRMAGLQKRTWGYPSDSSLRGVERLLAYMVGLSPGARRRRAATLWQALVDVSGRTPGAFSGTYKWGYYREERTVQFPAALVRRLNETAWVPSVGGEFRTPAEVPFETLEWCHDGFLLSKVRFKPPIVDQLAQKAGFEVAMLDKLKARGITTLAELEKLLPDQGERTDGVTSVEGAANALGVPLPSSSSVEDPHAEPISAGYDGDGTLPTKSGGHSNSTGEAQRRSGASSTSDVSFVSYVAVGVNDDGDPDDLVQGARMELEEAAIKLILSREQHWQRTPTNNEGFDLVRVAGDRECAWCEVKAMKGSLDDRPVGMSHAQFKCARDHGGAYWLYIVERAGTEDARIVKIKDPAGKAKTFTFDKGWLNVAEVD